MSREKVHSSACGFDALGEPTCTGEERFVLLDMSANQLLVVCHCEVEPDVIRIISVRKASRHERTEYESFRHA